MRRRRKKKEQKEEAKRGGPEEEEESKQITFEEEEEEEEREEEEEEERRGRGGFKRWYFEHLADPAVTASSRHCPPKDPQSQRGEEEKRQSTGHQLARILTKLTSGGKDPGRRGDLRVQNEDKKEAPRKKRRRKKKKGGGDPDESPSGNSSGMSSYDSDSQASWEERSTSSADRKMETPLRRKAKEKPGSVLQLLIEHARSQLDQSSIDLLRQGDLDLLGDTLAGRFS